jgi:hypothetical protein
MSNTKRLDSKGYSLIEVLIYLVLAMAIILGAYAVSKLSSDMSKSATTFVALHEIRNSILDNLKNDQAFKAALADSANSAVFACLNNKTSCAGAGGQYVLYDSHGVRIDSVARPGTTEGVTKDGKACNTVSPQGNDGCPFRYLATWAPRCPSTGTCLNPIIELKVKMELAAASADQIGALNTSSFNLFYVKGNANAEVADTCAHIGGVLQPDQTCKLPQFGKSCPPHYFIRGFSNGQPVCQILNGFKCSRGQVLRGIDSSGNAVCGPGCTDPSGADSGSIW